MGSVRRWWRSLALPWRTWRVGDEVLAGDEIPTRLPSRGAALVAVGGIQAWLAFDCPRGDGHRIMLNLDPRRYPHWTVRQSNPLTVWPSVDDRVATRRCHFVLRAGRVTWVQDENGTEEA